MRDSRAMSSQRSGAAIDDDDYEFDAPRPRRRSGLIVRGIDAGLRNPVMAAGALLSGVAIIVIVTNALANQPMRHPSPLFNTRQTTASNVVPVATMPIVVGDNPLQPMQDVPAVPQPKPVLKPTVADADPVPVAPVPQAATPVAVPPLANLTTQLTERIQQALKDRGFYTGDVDGIAGAGTTEAIRAFEQRMGVAATGDVNDRVLSLLKSKRGLQARAAASPPVVPVVQKPAAVATAAPPRPALMPAPVPPEPLTGSAEGRLQRVQRALNIAGYGPVRVDGRPDDRTTEAIRKFEAEHGLPITGHISERLIAALVVRSADAR